MPKFKIEQIAVSIPDAAAAQEFLSKIGLTEWFHDHVIATGKVFPDASGRDGRGYSGDCTNEADLRYNYQAGNGSDQGAGKPLELEILDYTEGHNWIEENVDYSEAHENQVSHLGMHVTAQELVEWDEFFKSEGVQLAQSVITDSHTNPHIAGKRRYNYAIYDTRGIIGVDLKFIVRLNQDGTPYEA